MLDNLKRFDSFRKFNLILVVLLYILSKMTQILKRLLDV